ncbi:MAG: hypothetical protein ACRDOU_26565, partial [Streptosporangiaceae bacterium]
SGSVWATTTQGLLIRLDAGSGRMRTFHAPVADEYGVTVTKSGAVWFGLASGSAVYSFNPASATFAKHPVPARSTPWWVTAGQGGVWVALGSDAQGGLTEVDTVG